MRLFILVTLLFSFSALAQTRVKENIKQQQVAVSEEGTLSPVKVIKKKSSKKD